jgi:Flp pilus assembly protein TadD
MKRERKTKIPGMKHLVLLIFVIAAFAVFFSSINSSFHLDDFMNITDNHDIKINKLSLSALKKAAFTSTAGLRPVSYFTFALNHYFSGMDTTSYHAVNIIIHIISAFLIYLIILALFGYDTADDGEKSKIRVSAFFTAFFWLLTPLNSHVVIYIVQRMSLLMTMFFLLAFYAYLLSKKRNTALYLALTGIFFVLSLLSKQNGITFPLVIILYELAFVKKGDLKNVTKKEKAFFMAVFLVLLATLFLYKGKIINSIVQGYVGRDFNMYERILTQPRVLLFYLSLLILPLPGRLSVTHDIVKSTSILTPITTLPSIICILFLFVFSIIRMKKSPYLSFAILWFFITISVESSILPLEMAYEHRMYLPCIFLIGVFTDFVVNKFYSKNKVPVIAVLLVIALLYGVLTDIRGKAWKDEFTIWSDAVGKYPDDGRAHYNLGAAYFNTRRYKEAESHYMAAVEKWTDSYKVKINLAQAYDNLGDTQVQLKKINDAEQNFIKAIEHKSDWSLPYNHLGKLYKNKRDYKKALEQFNNVIKINPNNSSGYINVGKIYYILKEYDKSIRYYNKAIALNPKSSPAYNGIGVVYRAKEDYRKALHYFEKALYYNPGDIMSKRNIQKVKKRLK